MQLEKSTNKLIPVTQWSQLHPWPPIGGLRHLIFNAHRNGFDSVIRRVGRRVLIDEVAFFDWVSQQASKHEASSTCDSRKGAV